MVVIHTIKFLLWMISTSHSSNTTKSFGSGTINSTKTKTAVSLIRPDLRITSCHWTKSTFLMKPVMCLSGTPRVQPMVRGPNRQCCSTRWVSRTGLITIPSSKSLDSNHRRQYNNSTWQMFRGSKDRLLTIWESRISISSQVGESSTSLLRRLS